MSWLWPVWIASLVGSLHCVGMCGGLVSFYSGCNDSEGQLRHLNHLGYHLTRLLAYALLGGVAGQIGATLDWAGRLGGLQQIAALVTGGSMILWGAVALLRPRRKSPYLQLSRTAKRSSGGLSRSLVQSLQSLLVTLAHRAREQPPLVRASMLGLSSALLPCGWLYAFVLAAAGTGSGTKGALLMLVFWTGTVPALLTVGASVQWLNSRLGPLLPRVSAVVLVCLGLLNVVGRWPTSSLAPSSDPSCHVIN